MNHRTLDVEILRSVSKYRASYDFCHADGRKGNTITYFRPLGALVSSYIQGYFDSDDDTKLVAEISHFFPNGKHVEAKPHMRKGVGTQALELITQEAITRECLGMYAVPITPAMRNFLTKNGFTGSDRGSVYYRQF